MSAERRRVVLIIRFGGKGTVEIDGVAGVASSRAAARSPARPSAGARRNDSDVILGPSREREGQQMIADALRSPIARKRLVNFGVRDVLRQSVRAEQPPIVALQVRRAHVE